MAEKFDAAVLTGVQIKGGQATFVAGTPASVTIETGWTKVYAVIAHWGATPTTEEPIYAGISGGTVTIYTATSSEAAVQYMIFGRP